MRHTDTPTEDRAPGQLSSVKSRPAPTLPEFQRLGEVLLVRRRRLGLSQDELAHRVGISRAHLGRIERGQMNVTLMNLLSIAQALGSTAGELLTEAKM